jgi:hypothetical protein
MNSEKENSVEDKIIAATNGLSEKPSAELKDQIISFINELINKDFDALIQLLYRVDVNEKKLKSILKKHQNVDASVVIADLIIERQLQKIATKKQFKSRENSNEDLW